MRGDLIRILAKLRQRRDKFDLVLIETTGLADPGPVAQTFFSDPEVKEAFVLDGIVTVVDAKHVVLHFDDTREVREQIGFADVILLNKTDLVSEEELARVEARIRKMNPMAKLYRTRNSDIRSGEGCSRSADSISSARWNWSPISSRPPRKSMLMSNDDQDHGHEHEEHEHHDHHHDEDITSVGIVAPGDVDEKKLGAWLGELLRTEGQNIFRMKGILAVEGRERAVRFPGRAHVDGWAPRPSVGRRRNAKAGSFLSAASSTGRS